jgi:hypothetical protein
VALLFPWAVGLDLIGSTGFWSAVIFLIIITLGFVYEWKRGALSWPHPALDLKRTVTPVFLTTHLSSTDVSVESAVNREKHL